MERVLNIKIKYTSNIKLNIFLCETIVIFAFLPFLKIFDERFVSLLRTALIGIFILVNSRKSSIFTYRVLPFLVCGFVFTIYSFIQTWQYETSVLHYLSTSMFCWLYCVYGIYFLLSTDKDQGKIINLITLIFFINSFTTIRMVSYDAQVARNLNNAPIYTDAETKFFYMGNTATWGIMYAMTLSLPYLIALFRKSRKSRWLIASVAILVCIIYSQLTLAFIYAVAMVFFSIYDLRSKNRRCILLSCTVIAAVIMMVAMDNILLFVNDVFLDLGMDLLAQRMRELSASFTMHQLQGGGAFRFQLYGRSFQTFLSYPIFGKQTNNWSEIGYHSQIFDTMGTTGLIGTCIYIVPFVALIKFYHNKIKDELIKYAFMISSMFFLVALTLNPAWYAPEIFMSVFLIAPLADKMCVNLN